MGTEPERTGPWRATVAERPAGNGCWRRLSRSWCIVRLIRSGTEGTTLAARAEPYPHSEVFRLPLNTGRPKISPSAGRKCATCLLEWSGREYGLQFPSSALDFIRSVEAAIREAGALDLPAAAYDACKVPIPRTASVRTGAHQHGLQERERGRTDQLCPAVVTRGAVTLRIAQSRTVTRVLQELGIYRDCEKAVAAVAARGDDTYVISWLPHYPDEDPVLVRRCKLTAGVPPRVTAGVELQLPSAQSLTRLLARIRTELTNLLCVAVPSACTLVQKNVVSRDGQYKGIVLEEDGAECLLQLAESNELQYLPRSSLRLAREGYYRRRPRTEAVQAALVELAAERERAGKAPHAHPALNASALAKKPRGWVLGAEELGLVERLGELAEKLAVESAAVAAGITIEADNPTVARAQAAKVAKRDEVAERHGQVLGQLAMLREMENELLLLLLGSCGDGDWSRGGATPLRLSASVAISLDASLSLHSDRDSESGCLLPSGFLDALGTDACAETITSIALPSARLGDGVAAMLAEAVLCACHHH